MVSDKFYRRMQLGCSCGHVSRNMVEEARHRHNFPNFCRPKAKQCVGKNKDGSRCRRTVLVKSVVTPLCRNHRK